MKDKISSSGTIYQAEEGGKNIENIVTVRRNDNTATPSLGFVNMSVEVDLTADKLLSRGDTRGKYQIITYIYQYIVIHIES